MNISATLNAFKLLVKPALCLPHATVPTFNDLPIPVSKAFLPFNNGSEPEIKAIILDKDDCFAIPGENTVYKPYDVRIYRLEISIQFYHVFWIVCSN